MSTIEKMNQGFHGARKKLFQSLAVDWLLPMVLVILLRGIFKSDTGALAIAGVIPVVRTIAIWIQRRRIDWIGILGALGFAMALFVTVLFGGSSLPLKLYHPVVTGIIGLAFLISAAVRRPLFIIILRVFKQGDQERFKSASSRKKFTIITAVFGLIFLVDAVIHIVMALTLPTVAFLAMSRVVTLICVMAIVVSGKLIKTRFI